MLPTLGLFSHSPNPSVQSCDLFSTNIPAQCPYVEAPSGQRWEDSSCFPLAQTWLSDTHLPTPLVLVSSLPLFIFPSSISHLPPAPCLFK